MDLQWGKPRRSRPRRHICRGACRAFTPLPAVPSSPLLRKINGEVATGMPRLAQPGPDHFDLTSVLKDLPDHHGRISLLLGRSRTNSAASRPTTSCQAVIPRSFAAFVRMPGNEKPIIRHRRANLLKELAHCQIIVSPGLERKSCWAKPRLSEEAFRPPTFRQRRSEKLPACFSRFRSPDRSDCDAGHCQSGRPESLTMAAGSHHQVMEVLRASRTASMGT